MISGKSERQWDFINCYVKKEHVKKITVERKNNKNRPRKMSEDNEKSITI